MPHKLSELELDEVSLVDTPANQHARVVLSKREGAIEMNTTFTDELVRKCQSAIAHGDVSGLSKSHFEDALDALAKHYAATHGVSFYHAYKAVLTTPAGSELYAAHKIAAPPLMRPHVEKRRDIGPASWQAIQQVARASRKAGESEAQAVARTVTENPALYDEYLAENGA